MSKVLSYSSVDTFGTPSHEYSQLSPSPLSVLPCDISPSEHSSSSSPTKRKREDKKIEHHSNKHKHKYMGLSAHPEASLASGAEDEADIITHASATEEGARYHSPFKAPSASRYQVHVDFSASALDFNETGLKYYSKGLYKKALDFFQKAIRADSTFKDAYFNRGVAFDAIGNKIASIEAYDQAIKVDPNYVLAYYNKGIVLYNSKKYKPALEVFDKALYIDTSDPNIYSYKGLVLQILERNEEALAAYDEAIRINPKYAMAHYNKGVVLYALERSEEAIAAYDEAIRIDPKYALAYFNEGVALCALKRYEEALKKFEQYRHFFPKDPDLQSALKEAKSGLYEEALTTNVGMQEKLTDILEKRVDAEKHLEEFFSVASTQGKAEKLLEKALMIISEMNDVKYFERIFSKLADICEKSEAQILGLLIKPNIVGDCPFYRVAKIASYDESDEALFLEILNRFKGNISIKKEMAETVIRILNAEKNYLAEQCKPLLSELCGEEIKSVKSHLLLRCEAFLSQAGEAPSVSSAAHESDVKALVSADLEMSGMSELCKEEIGDVKSHLLLRCEAFLNQAEAAPSVSSTAYESANCVGSESDVEMSGMTPTEHPN